MGAFVEGPHFGFRSEQNTKYRYAFWFIIAALGFIGITEYGSGHLAHIAPGEFR